MAFSTPVTVLVVSYKEVVLWMYPIGRDRRKLRSWGLMGYLIGMRKVNDRNVLCEDP